MTERAKQRSQSIPYWGGQEQVVWELMNCWGGKQMRDAVEEESLACCGWGLLRKDCLPLALRKLRCHYLPYFKNYLLFFKKSSSCMSTFFKNSVVTLSLQWKNCNSFLHFSEFLLARSNLFQLSSPFLLFLPIPLFLNRRIILLCLRVSVFGVFFAPLWKMRIVLSYIQPFLLSWHPINSHNHVSHPPM